MNKAQADEELKQIQIRLQELEDQRQAISIEEHRLHARKQEIMIIHYPEVIDNQINTLLRLRRLRRG